MLFNNQHTASSDEIEEIQNRQAPFILSMGLEEMHLVIDGMQYDRVDIKSSEALLALMASYYIFEMAYGTEVKPSILVLQASWWVRPPDANAPYKRSFIIIRYLIHTICCKSLVNSYVFIILNFYFYVDSTPTVHRSTDFDYLFTSQTSTEISFIVTGQVIKANRSILILPKEMDQIAIPGIASDVFYALLRYIYCEQVNLTVNNESPLLAAANQNLLLSPK